MRCFVFSFAFTGRCKLSLCLLWFVLIWRAFCFSMFCLFGFCVCVLFAVVFMYAVCFAFQFNCKCYFKRYCVFSCLFLNVLPVCCYVFAL